MKKDLPKTLKEHMLRSGLELHETEQNHMSCLSLVSSFVVLESETFFRYKDRLVPSEDNEHVHEDKIENVIMILKKLLKRKTILSAIHQNRHCIYL